MPVRSSPSIEMSMNAGMQTRSRPPGATYPREMAIAAGEAVELRLLADPENAERQKTHEIGDEARQKLNKLRSMYEPYLHSMAKNLMEALPPWRHPAKMRDNWQAGPWDRMIQAKSLAVLGQRPVQPPGIEDHF